MDNNEKDKAMCAISITEILADSDGENEESEEEVCAECHMDLCACIINN
jgi:hypothetical protein